MGDRWCAALHPALPPLSPPPLPPSVAARPCRGAQSGATAGSLPRCHDRRVPRSSGRGGGRGGLACVLIEQAAGAAGAACPLPLPKHPPPPPSVAGATAPSNVDHVVGRLRRRRGRGGGNGPPLSLPPPLPPPAAPHSPLPPMVGGVGALPADCRCALGGGRSRSLLPPPIREGGWGKDKQQDFVSRSVEERRGETGPENFIRKFVRRGMQQVKARFIGDARTALYSTVQYTGKKRVYRERGLAATAGDTPVRHTTLVSSSRAFRV